MYANEVRAEERGEKGVETERGRVEGMQEYGECAGGHRDAGKEGAAMAMVEAVTLFEIWGSLTGGRGSRVEQSRVE
jgi:hypothetical protein